MTPKYLPPDKRVPDTQYQNCLWNIMDKGIYTKHPMQTEGTYTSLTLPAMQFPFSNGFPILTERKIGFWRTPVNELFAFINGVRDANVLADEWGVKWWRDKWATPEKCATFGLDPYDLGDGSYGAAFHDFPTGGKPFNQFEHLILQIKKYPTMRTHVVKTWIPQYCLQHDELRRRVVVAPCHGDIQITILDDKLTLRMDQRSADFPIGIPSNMIQYAALTLAIAHLTGYEPYMFIHAPHDSQIYERHVGDVRRILYRKAMVFPEIYLTEEGEKLTSIFDFRGKHFEIRGEYLSHPAMVLADAVV